MADQELVLAPQTITVSVALEPVLSIFNSLELLAQVEIRSGFGEWVIQTAAQLSPEQKHRNRLVLDGFFHAIAPDREWPSFPDYIDHLETLDPYPLGEKALSWLQADAKLMGMGIEPLDPQAALANRKLFIDWLAVFHQKKSAEKEGDEFDEAFYIELHGLLNDPKRMQRIAVDHLREMWRDYLAAEWKRVLPMLQQSVDAFRQLDYSGSTPLQAIRAVTGRDLSGIWEPTLGNVTHITFVPSAHIGPYVLWFPGASPSEACIVFGARLPEGARVESPALNRSELLVRLSALADDTRLQILELLAQHDELCAQDIMTALQLTQSSTSRHLRQLSATGYIVERRREVAKCYSLNPVRFEDTMRALKRFVRPRFAG